MKKITMRDLLQAGVHFGHKTQFWHPKMAPFIYGTRNGVHIIDLEKTLPMLQEAIQFVHQVASRRGKVLFVATKPSAREIVKAEATRCGMPYVNHRWLGGMLTNYKTVRHSIKRLKALEEQFAKEDFGRLTKKEILNLTREKEKLDRDLGGIKDMNGLPDAIFVIDVHHEDIAVVEANKVGIPVIGVVDTNTKPCELTYMIPGNDDAASSVSLYLSSAADAILAGRSKGGAPLDAGAADEFIEVDDLELQSNADDAEDEE